MTTIITDVVYKSTTPSRDGLADFYEPDNPTTTGIIALHGGSWYFGSKEAVIGLGEYYAGLGYPVAACNYNLQADGESPGDHLPNSYEDVRDFVIFTRARYPNIPRWYILGHSAGGQIGNAVHARGEVLVDGMIALDHAGWDMPAMPEAFKDAYLRPYFTEGQLASESCNLIIAGGAGTSQSSTLAFVCAGILEDSNAALAQTYVDTYRDGVGGSVHIVPYEHVALLDEAYKPGGEVSTRILQQLEVIGMTIPSETFVVAPNATTGVQQLSDPDGSQVPPTEIGPVENLSITDNGTTSRSIGWSYSGTNHVGFDIDELVDGADTGWRAVGPVSATTREYSVDGLPAATLVSHRVRATAADGSASTWSIVEGSTLPNTSSGPYAVARVPLKIINPRPDSERGSQSRYSYNHSQMPYKVPISVVGGRPPFTFTITGIGSITPRAPAWNPGMVSWADVNVPSNTSGSYRVTVYDQDNNSDSVTVNVSVNDSKFCFVAPGGSGSGAIGSPIGSCQDWYGADGGSTSSFVDRIIVYRAGSYDAPDGGGTFIDWAGKRKPMGHIGYPGESATIVMSNSGNGHRGFYNNTGDSNNHCHDQFWGNLTISGGACFMRFNWDNDRQVFWDCHFKDIDANRWASGTDGSNIGGIIYLNGRHVYLSMTNCLWENCSPKSDQRNNVACFETYTSSYVALDGNTYKGVNWSHAVYIKSKTNQVTVTSDDAWEENYFGRAGFYMSGSKEDGSGWYVPIDVQNPAKQIRYSRYINYGSASDDSMVLTDQRDNRGYADMYLERSVTVNMWAKRPIDPYFRGVTMINDASYYVTPGWGDVMYDPGITVRNSNVGTNEDAETELNNSTGQILNPTYRYTRGWEV